MGGETAVQAEELKSWKNKLLRERDEIRQALDQQKSATASTAFDLGGEISAHSSHMADQGTDTMEREKAWPVSTDPMPSVP